MSDEGVVFQLIDLQLIFLIIINYYRTYNELSLKTVHNIWPLKFQLYKINFIGIHCS